MIFFNLTDLDHRNHRLNIPYDSRAGPLDLSMFYICISDDFGVENYGITSAQDEVAQMKNQFFPKAEPAVDIITVERSEKCAVLDSLFPLMIAAQTDSQFDVSLERFYDGAGQADA
jgi:hypothetical protein